MSNETSILVTTYDIEGKHLLKTALKFRSDDDFYLYWSEPEARTRLLKLLPQHNGIEIVAVEEIFDCKIYSVDNNK